MATVFTVKFPSLRANGSRKMRAHGHREVIPLQKPADLARIVKGLAGNGDLVVCLGAGNITQWAYALPGELKALG